MNDGLIEKKKHSRDDKSHLISVQFVCTVIAILLHYFYMCTFAWMFVEGLHIYRMLTELRNINHGHIRFYYAMGWGIPAIITGTATTNTLTLNRATEGSVWGFVL